ncbi:MAG: hypothetical protein ACK4ND_19140 [Cytophagaceae bacterium]
MRKTTIITNLNGDIPDEIFENLIPAYIKQNEASNGNDLLRENIKIHSQKSIIKNNDVVYEVEWEKI